MLLKIYWYTELLVLSCYYQYGCHEPLRNASMATLCMNGLALDVVLPNEERSLLESVSANKWIEFVGNALMTTEQLLKANAMPYVDGAARPGWTVCS